MSCGAPSARSICLPSAATSSDLVVRQAGEPLLLGHTSTAAHLPQLGIEAIGDVLGRECARERISSVTLSTDVAVGGHLAGDDGLAEAERALDRDLRAVAGDGVDA